MEVIIFNIFKVLLISSGFLVIHSKNPIHSVIFLILVFANAAGLLLLLEFEFLAMVLLVVYIGAIAVLFLFVVMMLNIKSTDVKESVLNYLPVGFVIVFVLSIELSFLVYHNFSINELQFFDYNIWVNSLYAVNNIDALGLVLYTYYFYLFLISGLVLLVAMIGAIVLTLTERKKSKHQNIFLQVNRDSRRTIRSLKFS